jgi:hypothetical protein
MKQNSKAPKSAKTRLSDLTPKKDAHGGFALTPPSVRKSSDPGRTPAYRLPVASTAKRHQTL